MEITKITPHSNADSLELAQIGGYQSCVRKGLYSVGDKVIFIEPGQTVKPEDADRLQIRNYLKEVLDIRGERQLVVKSIKLRGEFSHGLIVSEEIETSKFEPPFWTVRQSEQSKAPAAGLFGDLVNLRKESKTISDGQTVYVFEKIHGTNCGVGRHDGKLVAVSRRVGRGEGSLYWQPQRLIEKLLASYTGDIMVYGEIFGQGIQQYHYGYMAPQFLAFEIRIDGVTMPPEVFLSLCETYEIPYVPFYGIFDYSLELMENLSNGPTHLKGPNKFTHGREGIVVTTAEGLKCKYVGSEYLCKPGDTTDE